MLATAVELLAALAPPTAHVLDLGGGTGALSAAVLDRLPQVRVTLLDVDAAMLDEARRRLGPFGERVEFREGSFLDPLPTGRLSRRRGRARARSGMPARPAARQR